MPHSHLPATILGLLLLAAPALAQRGAAVTPPDPAAELRQFRVADGWEVTLFAADPLLAKPTQIQFDPAGRLWVACSETYPQIEPGKTANDKILILDDADGDGRADKTTVFADGLLIPTGVAPGDGGAYAADSTDLVHFSDPDPATGKARKKRVVLSGFGTEDTHHILHTLHWQPDGALTFNQSVYIHSHVETPRGVRRLNAGGVWRYRPESDELEVFARGWWNSWGFKWDRWGAAFATDGAGSDGVSYVVPGAYYAAAQGSPRLMSGMNPGSPKYCGLEILSGRGLPAGWDGNLITSDFRGHRVCRFQLRPDGSGYSSTELPELLSSSHPAFRPIDAAQGPDGAVYVADWYNPIIQHGEVDFRDPRRDKTHGRVWRVAPKSTAKPPKVQLVGATPEQLLATLEVPEQYARAAARRLLKERGADAVALALAKWLAGLPSAELHDQSRLEGLWLHQSIGRPNVELLGRLLASGDPRVRAAACRAAGDWRGALPDVPTWLASRAQDPHPQVRLEAVRALAALGTRGAAESAAKAMDQPLDRWLDYALWLTLRELAPMWLPDAQAGKPVFGGEPKKLLFALEAAGGDVAAPLVKLLDGGGLKPEERRVVLLALAKHGGTKELGVVLNDTFGDDELSAAVEEAARTRKVGPPDARGGLYIAADIGLPNALRLAGTWKLESMRAVMERHAAAAKLPAFRAAAMEGLARLGGPKSVETLAEFGAGDHPLEDRVAAVTALAELDPERAARLAVPLMQIGKQMQFISIFTARKGGPAALAAALKGQTLPPDVAKIALRAVKAGGQSTPALLDALAAAGGLDAAKRTYTRPEIEAIAAAAIAEGDAARGAAVYRRADMLCLKCHAIAGAGGLVGPDLSSLGGSAPVDYLVESMLVPNAKIKEGYHSQIITTADGKVLTGIKVREGGGSLTLRDAEGREESLPVADIDGRKDGPSLMPEGLTDPLTRGEFLDLVQFLSRLGKVGGGYAASPGGVVRRWEVVQVNKELYELTNRDRVGAAAKPGAPLTLAPAYSRVAGDLPLDGLPSFQPHKPGPAYTVVRFQIDVTQPGPAMLKLNDAAGVQLFLDGTPVAPGPDGAAKLDLGRGVRTVTAVVEVSARAAPLRAELADVPGAATRAAVVGGR